MSSRDSSASKRRKTNNPAPRDRPGVKLPRRAGHKTIVAWNRNRTKDLKTLGTYRTGYRTAWKVTKCRRYMKSIGLKEPGTYNMKNQQGGDMFSLPSEVNMNNKQACTIYRLCFEARLTLGQMKTVRAMLSYAYQLTQGEDGNWTGLNFVKKGVNVRLLKKTKRKKTKPVVIPGPTTLTTAFTTEYKPNCGMPFMRWNVGFLLSHDYTINGNRRVEDMKRIRDSEIHTFVPSDGWMATNFLGGRAKLGNDKEEREWKLYRTCFCPNGKHNHLPEDWQKHLDKKGNPAGPLPWCTTCPLNAFQCIRDLLPEDDYRTYPKWDENRGKFHKTHNEGEDIVHELFQKWLNVQGANPDGVEFDSNCGRKALAKWCAHFDVPYEDSFQIHGDHWTTWRRSYQNKLKRAPDFKIRTQSINPDDCIRAHRTFARRIGRGPPENKPRLNEEQRDAVMMQIMLKMGMGEQLNKILQS